MPKRRAIPSQCLDDLSVPSSPRTTRSRSLSVDRASRRSGLPSDSTTSGAVVEQTSNNTVLSSSVGVASELPGLSSVGPRDSPIAGLPHTDLSTRHTPPCIDDFVADPSVASATTSTPAIPSLFTSLDLFDLASSVAYTLLDLHTGHSSTMNNTNRLDYTDYHNPSLSADPLVAHNTTSSRSSSDSSVSPPPWACASPPRWSRSCATRCVHRSRRCARSRQTRKTRPWRRACTSSARKPGS